MTSLQPTLEKKNGSLSIWSPNYGNPRITGAWLAFCKITDVSLTPTTTPRRPPNA
ncbi:hypothetical protein FRB90_007706, partial [Tulasnella sp. 427]